MRGWLRATAQATGDTYGVLATSVLARAEALLCFQPTWAGMPETFQRQLSDAGGDGGDTGPLTLGRGLSVMDSSEVRVYVCVCVCVCVCACECVSVLACLRVSMYVRACV
jgi:hypothetical protein